MKFYGIYDLVEHNNRLFFLDKENAEQAQRKYEDHYDLVVHELYIVDYPQTVYVVFANSALLESKDVMAITKTRQHAELFLQNIGLTEGWDEETYANYTIEQRKIESLDQIKEDSQPTKTST